MDPTDLYDGDFSDRTSRDDNYSTGEAPNSNGSSNHFFEGVEKTLEVYFSDEAGPVDGLRFMSREQLDILCTEARCCILSKISNDVLDAYVLSESSLFVYKNKLVMKTCGRTTLLHCLSSLVKFTDDLEMELTGLRYSHKNLTFPDDQHYPHCSFNDEVKFIESHPELNERLRGSSHILGPISGDHWHVYSAEQRNKKHDEINKSKSILLSIMMFDLDEDVSTYFFHKNCPTSKLMREKTGIHNLVNGHLVDDFAFTPCGYSMNSICESSYSTIHVTPETHCSYASYETNDAVDDYSKLLYEVLTIFKPHRFVVTMFGEEDLLLHPAKAMPCSFRKIVVADTGKYARTSTTITEVDNDCSCLMGCFVRQAY